jgi:hypothetical protein
MAAPYLDKLALTDKTTIVLEKQSEAKIQPTSNSLTDPGVLLPGQIEHAAFDAATQPSAEGV